MPAKRVQQDKARDALALEMHEKYRGKVQMLPKCAIRGLEDFAIWYTPGVAAPSREIAWHTEDVYRYTNKGNSIINILSPSHFNSKYLLVHTLQSLLFFLPVITILIT